MKMAEVHENISAKAWVYDSRGEYIGHMIFNRLPISGDFLRYGGVLYSVENVIIDMNVYIRPRIKLSEPLSPISYPEPFFQEERE